MEVIKRNGEKEEISFDKIKNRLNQMAAKKPVLNNVDIVMITQKVIARIYNNIKTVELDEISANIYISMITTHPEYSILGSRIIISNNQKNTVNNFGYKLIKLYEKGIISEEVYNIYNEHKEKIEAALDYNRDFNFDYFGFKTLEKSYLQKINEDTIERIQDMIMRVSLEFIKMILMKQLKHMI